MRGRRMLAGWGPETLIRAPLAEVGGRASRIQGGTAGIPYCPSNGVSEELDGPGGGFDQQYRLEKRNRPWIA